MDTLDTCFFHRYAVHGAVLAVVWCLSVRLSVTFVYCVQTANNIVKLSRPDSPIILVS